MRALVLRRGLALRAPGPLGPELVGVALADWLFWGQGIGLSLALFCGIVGATALALSRRPGLGRRAGAALVLLASVAPMVEALTPLSLAFGLAGTLLAVQIGAAPQPDGWPARLGAAALRPLCGPVQIVVDLRRRQAARRRPARRGASWLAWILPLALTGVFLALFADANPIIAARLAAIPFPSVIDIVTGVPRALFWGLILVLLWPLLRMRRRRGAPAPAQAVMPAAPPAFLDTLLSRDAVLRALVLFNLLFALQLMLDGAVLWGGAALPDGVTYAAYAHRGAYPLVATALLAGGFVLVARRPGAIGGRLVPALVMAFILQNILLMVSALRRLALYVDAYSLTGWRLAAFVWMALVGIGLGLMLVQGWLGRGNGWLLSRTVMAALALLYGYGFIDAPRVIARYDVAHCLEIRGEGPSLDWSAMRDLGPGAIPAVDRYLAALPWEPLGADLARWRARVAAVARRETSDWRSWSFRAWRLTRYLDRSGVAEPAIVERPGGGDDGS